MRIDVHEFQKVKKRNHAEKSVLFLDVRTRAEHASERIPDVYNLPVQELEEHLDEIKKYDQVYLHCQTGRRSEEAQKILQKHGVHAINVDGGISAWKDMGLFLTKTAGKMPIMQQVLTIAGGMVLFGTLGGWLWSPWFMLLTGGVGAGLLFAGLSGHCVMAYILVKMPWNTKAASMPLPWTEGRTCVIS